MQETELKREQLSALVDGQLQGDAFAQTVDWLGQADEARSTWHAYHVVGDVLRAGQAIDSSRDSVFLARLKLGLQQETRRPISFDAPDMNPELALTEEADSPINLKTESANDRFFRWKWVAGLASLAVVSVIGWQAVSVGNDPHGAAQLAQATTPAITSVGTVQPLDAGGAVVMIRDPQLDALLAAHRQFGGTSALQMPAGFLRNATFEGAAR
jgi:sigma-E factor negative regulatory protein RseA